MLTLPSGGSKEGATRYAARRHEHPTVRDWSSAVMRMTKSIRFNISMIVKYQEFTV